VINEDPTAFAETIAESGVVILDVRTPEEFEAGHIEGALLIDYNNPTFPSKVAELDRTPKYAVYCRSGKRSLGAIAIMSELGFGEIHHLEEGILSWVWNGQPVIEGSGK